jgi:hypothetical protein
MSDDAVIQAVHQRTAKQNPEGAAYREPEALVNLAVLHGRRGAADRRARDLMAALTRPTRVEVGGDRACPPNI